MRWALLAMLAVATADQQLAIELRVQQQFNGADAVIEGQGFGDSRLLGRELVEVHKVYKGDVPRFILVANSELDGFHGQQVNALLSKNEGGDWWVRHTYALPATPDAHPTISMSGNDTSDAALAHPQRPFGDFDWRIWSALENRSWTEPHAFVPWALIWRQPWLAALPPLLGIVAIGGWVFLRARRRELKLSPTAPGASAGR